MERQNLRRAKIRFGGYFLKSTNSVQNFNPVKLEVYFKYYFLKCDTNRVCLSECCVDFRAWRGVGGDHHPVAGQRPLRLPVGHHPQRTPVRGVDLPPAPPGITTLSLSFPSFYSRRILLHLQNWDSLWLSPLMFLVHFNFFFHLTFNFYLLK